MRTVLLQSLLSIALASSLLAGCSTTAPTTRHEKSAAAANCWGDKEQIDERVKLLPGILEGQALAAVERVLVDAGGKQMQVTRTPHGLTAQFKEKQRNQFNLLEVQLEAWQWWEVRTRQQPQGTELCVQVLGTWQAESSGVLVKGQRIRETLTYPASLGDPKAASNKPSATPSRAVSYQTFWERLQFHLGTSAAARTCLDTYGRSGRSDRYNPAIRRLEIDPLCQVPIYDKTPVPAQKATPLPAMKKAP